MAIAPVSSFSSFAVGGVNRPAPGVAGTSGGDFAGLVKRGLEQVSQAEVRADSLLNRMAAGGDVAPHEVMIATTQASLAVEMTVAVRDKAVEAYREIMNMQL